MNIENSVKRDYRKNLDSIANEIIDIKINDYPNTEADAAWDKVSPRDIVMDYAYSLDERDIYYRFFNECIGAGREYQSRVDVLAIKKNELATCISVAKIPCSFILCAAGFFAGAYLGTEILMDNYGLFGVAGGGIAGIATGAIGGHFAGKLFGRRKYKKGFLNETRKIKEQALSDLMKTPYTKRLIEELKAV